MSFRQIFDRVVRIARAESMGGRRSSTFEEELRRAHELIEESRRPRRRTLEEEIDELGASNGASTGASRRALPEEHRAALRALGLPDEATAEQIGAAYRQRARELHPDRFSHLSAAEQREMLKRMQELNLAYEYLRHAGRR
jgi:hypothetical protein